MTLIVADRVMETSATAGTGALALAGAVSGYRAFAAVCADGDSCPYAIEAIDGNGNPTGAWEVGLGTFTGPATLARSAVQASSNAGAAVDFAAGTKRVMLSATASYLSAIGAGAEGSLTLLSEQAADGLTTAFTIASIPAAYKGLVVQCNMTANATLIVRCNNDSSGVAGTSGKYQWQRSGHANGAINNQALLQTGWGINATNTLNGIDLEMRILNHALASKKRCMATVAFGTAGSGNLAAALFAGLWDDAAAINRLDLIWSSAPTAGYIRLFGLN